jgi:hypothetical protein
LSRARRVLAESWQKLRDRGVTTVYAATVRRFLSNRPEPTIILTDRRPRRSDGY